MNSALQEGIRSPNSGNSGDSGGGTWPAAPADVMVFAGSVRNLGPMLVDVHVYTPWYFVARYRTGEGKELRPIRRTRNGAFELRDPGGLLPLYGADNLCRVVRGKDLLWVEGEAKADTLRQLGYIATTSAHGAASAHRSDYSGLEGAARVVIFPDNDDAGCTYGHHVALILRRLYPKLPILVAPIGDVVEADQDVDDLVRDLREAQGFDANGIRAALDALIAKATPWAGHPAVTESWPEEKSRPPRQPTPLPADSLPPVLMRVAQEYARASAVDVAAVLPALMVTLSGAVGNACSVRVSKRYGEPCTAVYALVGMASGERKSSMLAALSEPFHAAIAASKGAAEKLQRAYRARHKEITTRCESLRRQRAESEGETLLEDPELEQALADLGPPPIQLTGPVTDSTPEAILSCLADQGGACTVLSAEGRNQLDIILGLYRRDGKTADAVYLSAYSAEWVNNVREGREEKRRSVSRPTLSMCLMTQPDRFEEALGRSELQDSGFLARCDLIRPPSMLGRRQGSYAGDGVAAEAAADWKTIINALFGCWFDWITSGAERTPIELAFSPEAREAFGTFHDAIETRQGEGGDLEPFSAFASRIAGKAVRYAGLLHVGGAALNGRMGDAARTPITVETWRHAEQYARWVLFESLRLLAASRESADERRIAQFLAWSRKDTALRGVVQPSDLSKYGVAGCGNAKDAEALLKKLEQDGLARVLPKLPGESVRRYAIHPGTRS